MFNVVFNVLVLLALTAENLNLKTTDLSDDMNRCNKIQKNLTNAAGSMFNQIKIDRFNNMKVICCTARKD